MPTLLPTDVDDLVASTLDELGGGKITEIATDLQDHIAMNRLLRKSHVTLQGGTQIQFQAIYRGANNFRFVGMFNRDNLNQRDGTTTASIPWRFWTTGMTWDRRQLLMNRGKHEIQNFVKEKRYMTMIEMAEELEGAFWGEPTDANDSTTPYGVKCHLTYNATEGFNGGNHATLGAIGLNRTTYPRAKNWTANYAAVSKEDLVRKMRKAARYCNFKPAVASPPIGDYSTGKKYEFYTTYDVLYQFEEALEAQNQNLGNDIASKDGATLFHRIPIVDVPYLTENESDADPVVGIDWGVFKTAVLKNFWMVTSKPKESADHNVLESHMDGSLNWYLVDPRKCFLIAKSDWSA